VLSSVENSLSKSSKDVFRCLEILMMNSGCAKLFPSIPFSSGCTLFVEVLLSAGA